MDFDLSGIFKLVLDFLYDVVGNEHHLVVVHHIRLDHDSDFTSRLNCVGFFNAVEFVRYLFKLRQSLDVVLEVFASCTGSCGGNRVGSLNDERGYCLSFNVSVVSFNRVDDFLRLLVLAGNLYAELYVRAFDLLRESFSDIVEKSGALCYCGVNAQLVR